jgi:hypothetical protein
MKHTIVHAYADENMDLELIKFETTEIRIPNIVEEVDSKTTEWQHILITYPNGYIGFDKRQWREDFVVSDNDKYQTEFEDEVWIK